MFASLLASVLLPMTLLATQPPTTGTSQPPLVGAASPERLMGDLKTLVSFGTRHTLSATDDPKRGIGAAREWIKSRFESIAKDTGAGWTVELDRFMAKPGPRIPREVEIANVVATLPRKAGTPGPERFVYALGHYDSRNGDALDATGDAPGANDDGSGTVALLEIARLISEKYPQGLDQTIVLIATAGEEQGLIGATHAAQFASSQKRLITAVLNMDMVGDPTGTPDAEGKMPRDDQHIRVFSEGIARGASAEELAALRANSAESDSASRQLARAIVGVASRHATPVKPMLIFRPDRFLRGGDHSPFNEVGYAAVRFTHVYENYDRQHQNVVIPAAGAGGKIIGDLERFVDGPYLAGVSTLVASSAVSFATAPPAPVKVRVLTKELSVDSSLKWEAAEGAPAGTMYQVVWRETTSADWQHVIDLGDVREARVDVNKDNAVLGVRAVRVVGGVSFASPVVLAVAGRE